MSCNDDKQCVDDIIQNEEEMEIYLKRIEEMERAIRRHLELCPIKDEVLASAL